MFRLITSQIEFAVLLDDAATISIVPADARLVSDCLGVYEKDGLVQYIVNGHQMTLNYLKLSYLAILLPWAFANRR